MTRLEHPRVKAKTADYTIGGPAKDDFCGTLFTNRGASGAVVFTLPAPSAAYEGWWYDFLVHADQSVTIQTATADTLVTKNDAAADSVAASTATEKIGALLRAICDGTSWYVVGLSVGHTFTVAT